MNNNTRQSNETMHHEFCRLGDSCKAILRSTPRPVTLFGGLVVLIEFWRDLHLAEALRSFMPFEYLSPNSIGPVNILLAFWLGVSAGARRFSHASLLRADLTLHELPGCGRGWPCGKSLPQPVLPRMISLDSNSYLDFFPAPICIRTRLLCQM